MPRITPKAVPDATPDDGVANENCTGYELMSDLDFDADGDSRTWDSADYTLGAGDSQTPYFDTSSGGWEPIGGASNPFSATLEGNGFVIRNLAIRRNQGLLGLFGATTGTIRNLGLEQVLADYTGSIDGDIFIGTLVGRMTSGSITTSYASGVADGGDGDGDVVGGLVGQSGGTISGSYAAVTTDGGAGHQDVVGGLVGRQNGGAIIASHATGTAAGGGDSQDAVGGLVGQQMSGAITASHSSGTADGGAGDGDYVGGPGRKGGWCHYRQLCHR